MGAGPSTLSTSWDFKVHTHTHTHTHLHTHTHTQTHTFIHTHAHTHTHTHATHLWCTHPLADEKLVHLDPHYCQRAVDMTNDFNIKVCCLVVCHASQEMSQCVHPSWECYNVSIHPGQSYHCGTPRKLTANRMDPSCTLGFYCRDLEDFYSFKREAEPVC